jgi:hypothetical protein
MVLLLLLRRHHLLLLLLLLLLLIRLWLHCRIKYRVLLTDWTQLGMNKFVFSRRQIRSGQDEMR